MAGFEEARTELAALGQQQTDLQRAVVAGELWMEAGVAERAAQRCEQTVKEIEQLLVKADAISQKRRFGANEDGLVAAERFALAGEDFTAVMRGSQQVFTNMALTYRAAGRAVAEADAVGGRSFRDQTK